MFFEINYQIADGILVYQALDKAIIISAVTVSLEKYMKKQY